ncbi:elongin-A isoform X3 [Hippoglossus hippoglossus]|uniref:elongin-A isoform X3 n=1 Tax=Hippoglossus hippoglossus TaxID=8267 RepID=UPI00148B7800|nr:elongin-A isoform X3 [Hippoglossus hippoglossus]
MAEELLEAVDRLQSRLQENQEPRKLLKTLKRLGELPMTVDILVETGVGKSVNSFRKHEIAGEVAKSLIAKWKKLVPQSADRPNSHAIEASRPHPHSRGPEADDGGVHRRTREPSPEEEPSYMEEEEAEEEEERGYHTNYSPSPPQHEQYSPPQRGGYQSDEYESPEPEPEPEPEPSPPHKEVRHAKPYRDPSKNHHHGDRSRERDEERRQRHTQTSSNRGDDDEGKKRGADRERRQSPVQKPAKHNRKSTAHESKREEKKKGGDEGRPRAPKESQSKEVEEDFETPTMSFESFLTYDAPMSVKKKKKPSSSSSHSRPSHSSSSSSSSHRTRAPPPPATSSSSTSSSKVSKANGAQSKKRPHSSSSSSAAAPTPEKRKRVVEAVPTLPEIPLPAIQPNYRPLPSLDITPLSPQRRKVPVLNEEEDSGFTGKRFNSKMVVYSGSKTAYLPKMMTLYEQCIRVLQNNIDSIAEVGGVPFDILEPVLERCTPEQLYRIEQSNQCFTEDSDELWMRHCQRDFKRASPQEYESWRELYLRLHDEREERLRMLTQNITSAHANKPKGRQVKMAFVNSVAKPPRDVRRRQERFGTTSGSSAASTAASAPIKIRPATINYSGETSRASLSQNDPSPSSSRSSAPSGGGGGGGGGSGGGGGAAGHVARDKPQVKSKNRPHDGQNYQSVQEQILPPIEGKRL